MDKTLIVRYLEDARIVAKKSDCLSRKVGAIIGSEDKYCVCGAGWNASPLQDAGLGCRRKGVCTKRLLGYKSGEGHEHCMAIHAEIYALLNMFKNKDIDIKPWYPFEDKALFVTHMPCSSCAKILIQCGIYAVYYSEPYPDMESMNLFSKYNVAIRNVSEII